MHFTVRPILWYIFTDASQIVPSLSLSLQRFHQHSKVHLKATTCSHTAAIVGFWSNNIHILPEASVNENSFDKYIGQLACNTKVYIKKQLLKLVMKQQHSNQPVTIQKFLIYLTV